MNLLEVVVVGVVVVVVVAGAVVVAPEPTDFYGLLVYSRAYLRRPRNEVEC
jgi:hypothetical protein